MRVDRRVLLFHENIQRENHLIEKIEWFFINVAIDIAYRLKFSITDILITR